MARVTPAAFAPGGYRYLPGVFQYSAGVAALPGFQIERVTFGTPVALHDGFEHAARLIAEAGRPPTAFCACEAQSPAQFSEAAFHDFNQSYVAALARWGLIAAGANPVARSNVCPEQFAPEAPAMHAFSYAAPAAAAAHPTFVISGSGEVPEGQANYRDHIVSPGDAGPAGMRAKVRFVRGEMERRLAGLGLRWRDVTATQLYSVHSFHACLDDELVAPGAARHGLTWHFCRPPIAGLDFEMDCRSVASEKIVRP